MNRIIALVERSCLLVGKSLKDFGFAFLITATLKQCFHFCSFLAWRYIPLIKLLIAKGAGIYSTNDKGDDCSQFALGGAIELVEVIELLITQSEINPFAVNHKSRTSLHRAASKGSDQSITLFLNQPKATQEAIDRVDNYGDTALHDAVQYGMLSTARSLLIEHGTSVDVVNKVQGSNAAMRDLLNNAKTIQKELK